MSLFIGRLSAHVGRDDIVRAFEAFGRMERCEVKYVGSRLVGYVTYRDVNDAQRAMASLQNACIRGTCINIEWARAQKPAPRSNVEKAPQVRDQHKMGEIQSVHRPISVIDNGSVEEKYDESINPNLLVHESRFAQNLGGVSTTQIPRRTHDATRIPRHQLQVMYPNAPSTPPTIIKRIRAGQGSAQSSSIMASPPFIDSPPIARTYSSPLESNHMVRRAYSPPLPIYATRKDKVKESVLYQHDDSAQWMLHGNNNVDELPLILPVHIPRSCLQGLSFESNYSRYGSDIMESGFCHKELEENYSRVRSVASKESYDARPSSSRRILGNIKLRSLSRNDISDSETLTHGVSDRSTRRVGNGYRSRSRSRSRSWSRSLSRDRRPNESRSRSRSRSRGRTRSRSRERFERHRRSNKYSSGDMSRSRSRNRSRSRSRSRNGSRSTHRGRSRNTSRDYAMHSKYKRMWQASTISKRSISRSRDRSENDGRSKSRSRSRSRHRRNVKYGREFFINTGSNGRNERSKGRSRATSRDIGSRSRDRENHDRIIHKQSRHDKDTKSICHSNYNSRLSHSKSRSKSIPRCILTQNQNLRKGIALDPSQITLPSSESSENGSLSTHLPHSSTESPHRTLEDNSQHEKLPSIDLCHSTLEKPFNLEKDIENSIERKDCSSGAALDWELESRIAKHQVHCQSPKTNHFEDEQKTVQEPRSPLITDNSAKHLAFKSPSPGQVIVASGTSNEALVTPQAQHQN